MAEKHLTPAVDWLDTLIDPRGLLVEFGLSHFAVQVSVLWVKLGKK